MLADPTFGIDHYALALVALLSRVPPDFAEFNEAAQRYEINLQTGLYLQGGHRWVSLAMYPTFEAHGLCHVVIFGTSDDGRIEVRTWGAVHLFREGPSPTEPHRGIVDRFDPERIMDAVAFIKQGLATAYGALRLARTVASGLPSQQDGTSRA